MGNINRDSNVTSLAKPAPSLVSEPPLCVDLDGTLVRTDVLVESVFALLKRNILYLFLLPIWLCKGKANVKQKIADRVELDVDLFPYNSALLKFLVEQKAQGRRLILATASNTKYAYQIAGHLGIFDGVRSSDADINLSGFRKRQCLIRDFGERKFDYAGNAPVDLEIWTHARRAILVDAAPSLVRKAERTVAIERVFNDRQPRIRALFRSLRFHQWAKNLLLFVPLAMAHQVGDLALLVQAFMGFLAFGLCASSVYVLNDLLDLPADRRHPSKRLRPLACGAYPIKWGVLLVPALLVSAFLVALLLPVAFVATLALYYTVTVAYSFKLKRTLLLDVLTLAGLYTVRLLAGAAAVSVAVSFWLQAFSMFLFLSLALVKRYSELLALTGQKHGAAHGRSYEKVDLETLGQLGASSGYLAVLVLALYIDSEQGKLLYAHPQINWLLCPLLLYWISRIWLLTRRGEMHEDPVVFAIRDQRSYWLGLIALIIVLAAT